MPTSPQLKESTCSREDIDSITNQMVRLGIVDEIYGIALSNVDYILRHQIVPKFWSYFNMQNEPERSFYHFQLAICELHKEYERLHKTFRRMQPIVERLSRPIDIPTELNMLLKTTLLSQLPYNFNEVVYAFYQTSFKVFANSHQELGEFICIFVRIKTIHFFFLLRPRRWDHGRNKMQWLRGRDGKLSLPGIGDSLQ